MNKELIKENVCRYVTAIQNIVKHCEKPDNGIFSCYIDMEKFIPLARSITDDYFKGWVCDDIVMDMLAYISIAKNAAFIQFMLDTENFKNLEKCSAEDYETYVDLKNMQNRCRKIIKDYYKIIGVKMGLPSNPVENKEEK